MSVTNTIYSIEQVAKELNEGQNFILSVLNRAGILFIEPDGGLIINPFENKENVYFLSIEGTIYATTKGKQKIQELLKQNKQNDVLNKQEIRDLIKAQGQHNTDLIINEELAELTKAFTKYRRYQIDSDLVGEKDESTLRHNLVEEIADVTICIEMLKSLFALDQSEITEAINTKMRRNLNRIYT